jgi:hypothetical protein
VIFSPSRAVSIAWLLASDRQAMAPIPCPHSYLESGPLRPAIKEEAPIGDEIKGRPIGASQSSDFYSIQHKTSPKQESW